MLTARTNTMPDSRRNTFDSVACRYDEIRPGYPDEPIDDVECLSGIPDDGSIPEIGCGTGHATSQHLSSCFRTAPFERCELGTQRRVLATSSARVRRFTPPGERQRRKRESLPTRSARQLVVARIFVKKRTRRGEVLAPGAFSLP